MSGVTRHRVIAVVGQLCVEPPVKCCNKCHVRRRVAQLSATLDVLVGDGDLAGGSRLQLGQTGHVLPVNARRA